MQLIITGDKSRYQFFREMVDGAVNSNQMFFTEKIGENDIYLTSDRSKVKDRVFYSDRIPLNTIVFFPKEFETLITPGKFTDRVVIFDEFPYATDEDISNLEQIIQKGEFCQLEVVLFQNDRTALSSDISTEKTAIEDAKLRYENYNINVQCYHTKDKPDFLLWSSAAKYDSNRNSFIASIRNARDSLSVFDSCYDLEYELVLHSIIENPENLERNFKYEYGLQGKSIWKVYFDKVYNFYWVNNSAIDEFIVETYRRNVTDLCVWDLSVDINEMKQAVRKLFSKQFEGFNYLAYNGDEKEYAQFVNKHLKEILAFKQKIVHFFTDELKQFLKMRITKDIERMERVLNENNY